MKRILLFCMSLWTLCAFTTTAVAEEVDYTSYIVNADLSTADAWNTEGTKGIKDGMVKVGSQAVYDFSQTITIPAGQYKLTAKAVYRYGSDEQAEYDAIKAGTDTHKTKLYVQTSAETYEANVYNRNEGASETDHAAGNGSVTINEKFVPNSSAAVQAWFDAGQYVNELVFNVLEEGQVKIGITTTDGVSGDYVNIGAWTLTRTGDAQNTGEGEGEGEGEGDDTNTIDVDKTSAVNTDCAAWGGGWCGTQFAPAVTTADGRTAQMAESYNGGSCTVTGTILSQTVTGLDNGTYTVEIYANAMWANGVDEANSTVDNAMDVAYVFAGENQVAIKAQRISSTSANGEYIIEGVEVTDGTLVIGLGKWKPGTNWHTIQIKSLTLHTTGDAALVSAKERLAAAIATAQAVTPTTDELTAAIATAQGVYDTATVAADVDAATAALEVAITIANNTNSVAGASATNPIVTNFVVNGTFDAGISSWKSTTGAQNNQTQTGKAGGFSGAFYENWHPSNITGKMYQTINDIPNGVYELTISAFVGSFANNGSQYVYANDAKTYLTTGDPIAYKVIFAVTDNTAEIGFEQTEAVNQWCAIDNVSLAYYGNCTIDEARFGSYIKQVTELRATATEYLTKVNEANKAALEAALAASESIEQTEEAYQTAVATLTAAINAAKANADVKVAIDNMYDLLASTNVYTQEAYETFKAAADAYLAKWDTNELTETVVNPYAITDWRATGITHDDLLISAWGIAPEMWDDMHVNTWSVEGGNDGTNFNVPFIEYWTGDANSLAATTKTATVAGLTPGAVCKVSAWVRVRAKNGQTDPTGITLSVGAEGTPVDVTEGVQVGTSQFFLAEYVAMGTADAEGNLTISFNIAADNNISWLSFKNVKYTVVPTGTNLDFSEGTPIDNGICTYGRDMEKNSTTYYSLLDVAGWTKKPVGSTEDGYDNNQMAAGVFAYGGTPWLGGAGYLAPATNPEGVAEGNALGLIAVWSATVQYTQPVTLLPGNYVLTVPVYNTGAGKNNMAKNLIGFIAENGTEYLAKTVSYASDKWTNEVITFTLDEVTNGVLSLGYSAPNAGGGNNHHLFIDRVDVKRVSEVDLAKASLAAAIEAAQVTVDAKANVGEGLFMIPTAAYDTYAAAVAAAQASYDAAATVADVEAAIAALAAATEAYAATPVTAPAADKTYQIMHEAAGTFLTLNGGVKVEAEASPLSFVAAGDGKYYIANANGEYAYYSGTGDNKWSLNVSADNKEAWTIAAVGNGAYTIKGKNGFLGTDAATAGSTCYGNKAATNWVITEYVEPVAEFEVTMVNPAGATAEKIAEGESVEFTTNWDDKVGYMLMTVEQIDPATSEVVDVVTSFGTPVKGETSWKAEAYFDVKFREGFSYKFTFYAYENEDAYNQEPWEAPYSAAIATDEVEIAGALAAYVYSTATLNDIKPAYDAVIESETDNVVTLTFSAPVKVQDAQSVVREGGFMAPPTVYTYTPVAVDADENGFATTWTFEMKLFPGSTNVTFAAVDAEGRRVQGNMGEEETSYFSYEWTCTVGIPDITIAPAGEVEGPVAALTASCEAGIGDFTWACPMGDAVVVNAAGEIVATVTGVEKAIDESLEKYSEEWYAALATAPNTLTLSAEITEPGTYTVKIPAGYFTVDSEKMFLSKATEATFTILTQDQVGINGITAGDVVETEYFNINGAALNAPVKGINVVKMTLKNGKVVTSKVYVK